MCFTPAELILGMLASLAVGIVVGAVVESRLRAQADVDSSNRGDPLT